ncbi:NAD+ synthase [Alloscardovia theropitheci]|nr:NAD+ synthase [Alloscardovia theropitheci]
MTKAESLTFALAQVNTSVGDIESNSRVIFDYASRAYEQGAHIVVFPEMTLTGYPIEDLALRATFRKAAEDSASAIARKLKNNGYGDLFVVVGTVGTSHDARSAQGVELPTNTLLVLHDGEVIHSYDKQFLPNYGVFDEFRIFTPGHRTLTMQIDGYRLGFAICEDIWQDNGPAQQLADADLDALVTINGSPFEENKDSVRLDLCIKRAQEVNAPVVYVNQVGGQDDLVFDGGSFVVSKEGTVLARLNQFDQDMRTWTLHADGTSTADELAREMDTDEKVYRACVLGLEDYMRKNGFKGVVLGLSGGIDSALVAAMAADACGGENVWGISMPSMYSSDGSKDDAADLAQNIGAHYEIQPIEPIFTSYQEQLNLEGIAQENLQARIRGVIVMAYSNSHGLLALATGNKSECACGYSTIYGDAVGGYAPIKDLLKTRVWQLARWRNSFAIENGQVPPIPENSIIKPPSAELRPGQKDSDSLPEYELLDAVLEAYIEKAHGRADLLADGFDEKTVDTVMRLVDRAEWKRRQYPLGPKVTALAFGRDRRLPVTNAFRE